MRFNITGRNIDITPGLRDAITDKLSKLEKFFSDDTEAKITLSVQKDAQKIEVTIPTQMGLIRAEESSSDMYVTIDLVEEIIERQIKKFRKKLIDRKQASQSFSDYFINEASEYEDDDIKIAKTKKFAIKPMDPEEACLQMEMLGHSFYVFLNSETDLVSVVYKRKGGAYGIIEPEV